MRIAHKEIEKPYVIMLCVYILFIITALIHDSPYGIYKGLQAIFCSRSVLLTDYIFVGGLGATLINSAIVGSFGIFMLVYNDVKPNGSIIMALWLTTGFALFGKNLFNMLPITFGVYLYSRYQKEPFRNFSLVALLSSTLSPVVSGIAFSKVWVPESSLFEGFDAAFLSHAELRIALGILLGIFAGFLFPAVSSFTMRVHGGYNLYNMGFAGGIISTFLVSALSSVGITMETNIEWSRGNNLTLAILLYIIFAGHMILGLFFGGRDTLREYPKLMKSTGRLVTDFYAVWGKSVYFNIGVTGAIATTVMLLLGCDLNGPTLSGIFTIAGFSAFGKHPRNILPLMLGAIISTNINLWDPKAPSNTLAILFSTGLAPIAGEFGWAWGVVAGFLHVNTVMHIGFLNSGFNLYNNGYAAGFVALLLVPIITAFKKETENEKVKVKIN